MQCQDENAYTAWLLKARSNMPWITLNVFLDVSFGNSHFCNTEVDKYYPDQQYQTNWFLLYLSFAVTLHWQMHFPVSSGATICHQCSPSSPSRCHSQSSRTPSCLPCRRWDGGACRSRWALGHCPANEDWVCFWLGTCSCRIHLVIRFQT